MQAEQTDTNRHVAVIGLGQMGRGIARNLDESGLLCAASDLRPGAFAEAGLSEAVRDLGSGTDWREARVLVFAVPSTTEIAAILSGAPEGGGRIIVDLTTSAPADSRALAEALRQRGYGYVDAAMTGGAAGADAGNLTLMIGGTEADVATCEPTLAAISSRRFHLGGTGTGHAMKLVHNLILHSSFMATCEGLRIAERAGLDLDQAVEVLNAGNARSFVTEVRFPRDILSGTMMARSRIANLEKDLGLAQDFAAGLDGTAPYTELTRALLAQAVSSGHAETDFSWLFPLYENLVELPEAKT